MKVHIVIRLVMHVLVLVGLLGFLAMYPYSWPPLFRIDLLVKACGHSPRDCLEWFSHFWAVIIVSIAVIVMDIWMLRRSGELRAWLSRSVAMELLLPAGWVLVLLGAPAWYIGSPDGFVMLLGPPIALSALASSVAAWLLVKDSVKAAASVARVWITGVIAVVLTLIAVAMLSLFAFVGVLMALYPPTISSGGP